MQDIDSEFNLILLLDCSTSTLVDRKSVLESAKQFVLAAGQPTKSGSTCFRTHTYRWSARSQPIETPSCG